ncbi:hypothetical protein [Cystobacter ferrugineus]|nr:hypothetical protein [Cystobacter ferrugineus]
MTPPRWLSGEMPLWTREAMEMRHEGVFMASEPLPIKLVLPAARTAGP